MPSDILLGRPFGLVVENVEELSHGFGVRVKVDGGEGGRDRTEVWVVLDLNPAIWEAIAATGWRMDASKRVRQKADPSLRSG